MGDNKIIAVCGKGGVGKTSISSLIVKVLLEQPGKKILAIDADPAVGLSTSLGVEPCLTIDNIRNELIEKSIEGSLESRQAMLARLDYRVFEAMVERDGFAFLAIGRPEAEGCYCSVNDYLKDTIEALSADFDYVVIDGEAGIEQINRRVMDRVTHLLLVSDASLKGINVIRTISEVAEVVTGYERKAVILNRLHDTNNVNTSGIDHLELLACLPEQGLIREFDIQGRSLLDLPENPALEAVRNALKAFDFIG